MKKYSTIVFVLLFSLTVLGQENSKDENIKVIIKKTTIQDGDTTVEEKTLTGEDAIKFDRRHDHMKKMRRLEGDHKEMRHRRMHKSDCEDCEHNVERIIIERGGENSETDELRHRVIRKGGPGGDKKVIIRTEIDEEGAENIEIRIDDDEMVIVRDGNEEVIELDKVQNKIIQTESSRNGKKTKRIIIIEDEKIIEEIEESNSDSKIGPSGFELNIFPNPNNGEFQIEYNLGKFKNAELKILDINGKTVFEDQLKGKGLQKKQINLNQYGSGIYFVNLEQADEVMSKKIIVE